jgi:hypothetical protein
LRHFFVIILTRLTRTAATGDLLLCAFLPFLANAVPPHLVSRPEAGFFLMNESLRSGEGWRVCQVVIS